MHEIFVVGSLLFWALVIVEVGLLLLFTEYENGIGATVSIFAFMGALQFLGNVDIIGHFWQNPWHLGLALIAYVLLGMCWMTFQWVRFVKAKIRKHDEILVEFLESKGITGTKVVPPELKQAWKDRVESTKERVYGRYEGPSIADVPKIKNNKAKAIRWMSLWPFSLSLFLFKDMVREAWNAIYIKIAGYLQRIADNLWRSDIKSNLED